MIMVMMMIMIIMMIGMMALILQSWNKFYSRNDHFGRSHKAGLIGIIIAPSTHPPLPFIFPFIPFPIFHPSTNTHNKDTFKSRSTHTYTQKHTHIHFWWEDKQVTSSHIKQYKVLLSHIDVTHLSYWGGRESVLQVELLRAQLVQILIPCLHCLGAYSNG